MLLATFPCDPCANVFKRKIEIDMFKFLLFRIFSTFAVFAACAALVNVRVCLRDVFNDASSRQFRRALVVLQTPEPVDIRQTLLHVNWEMYTTNGSPSPVSIPQYRLISGRTKSAFYSTTHQQFLVNEARRLANTESSSTFIHDLNNDATLSELCLGEPRSVVRSVALQNLLRNRRLGNLADASNRIVVVEFERPYVRSDYSGGPLPLGGVRSVEMLMASMHVLVAPELVRAVHFAPFEHTVDLNDFEHVQTFNVPASANSTAARVVLSRSWSVAGEVITNDDVVCAQLLTGDVSQMQVVRFLLDSASPARGYAQVVEWQPSVGQLQQQLLFYNTDPSIGRLDVELSDVHLALLQGACWFSDKDTMPQVCDNAFVAENLAAVIVPPQSAQSFSVFRFDLDAIRKLPGVGQAQIFIVRQSLPPNQFTLTGNLMGNLGPSAAEDDFILFPLDVKIRTPSMRNLNDRRFFGVHVSPQIVLGTNNAQVRVDMYRDVADADIEVISQILVIGKASQNTAETQSSRTRIATSTTTKADPAASLGSTASRKVVTADLEPLFNSTMTPSSTFTSLEENSQNQSPDDPPSNAPSNNNSPNNAPLNNNSPNNARIDGENDNDNIILIVIFCAAVAVIILLAIAVVVVIRKRRSRNAEHEKQGAVSMDYSPTIHSTRESSNQSNGSSSQYGRVAVAEQHYEIGNISSDDNYHHGTLQI